MRPSYYRINRDNAFYQQPVSAWFEEIYGTCPPIPLNEDVRMTRRRFLTEYPEECNEDD